MSRQGREQRSAAAVDGEGASQRGTSEERTDRGGGLGGGARSRAPRGSERGGSNPRRELTAAVLGSAAAGGLGLFAGGQTWARIVAVRPDPLPPVTDVLSGSSAVPPVPAAGLVLLAGAVALVAVRGSGRVVVGLLIAAAGGVLAWAGLRAVVGGLEASAARLPVVGGTPVVETSAGWPAVAVVAGLVGVCAGLLTALRGRHWPAMGQRYERGRAPSGDRATASRPPTDEDRAQLAWQALDRGEDPTDPASDRSS